MVREYKIDGPDRELLTLAEVLAYLGVRKTKLYELMGLGQFPRPQQVGGHSRWSGRDIACYVAIADRLRPSKAQPNKRKGEAAPEKKT